MAALSFSFGCLFYVISTMMKLKRVISVLVPLEETLGSILGLLAAIFYFKGWENAWKEER